MLHISFLSFSLYPQSAYSNVVNFKHVFTPYIIHSLSLSMFGYEDIMYEEDKIYPIYTECG